ncbi:MAG: TIGR02996 domain-containing protein [Kofleriaceae bacterium]
MADESRFLEAIVAAPDDDAPRLVFADYLTEQGDPRGELIALQCQLAAAPDDDRRRTLLVAANKLVKANRDAWTAPVIAGVPIPKPGYPTIELEWKRGMVERLELPHTLLSSLPRIMTAAPTIRELVIVSGANELPIGQLMTRPSIDALADMPNLGRLHTLEISLRACGNDLARVIARTPSLGNLRRLELHGTATEGVVVYYQGAHADKVFDDDGVKLLAGAKHLKGLTELDLQDNRIRNPGLRAIADAGWKLVDLNVATNGIALTDFTKAELTALFAKLPGLVKLSLGTNVIHEAAGWLVGGPHLAKLVELDIEKGDLSAVGAEKLAKAFALPALRRLRIDRNSLGDKGAASIAGCKALAQLTQLEMGHNRIGAKGGTAIATSPHLANLEQLNVNEPKWKDDMKDVFLGSPTLAKTRIYYDGRLLARGDASKAKPKKKAATKKR